MGIMYKAATVIMAKGANPVKHKAKVKGDAFEYTLAVVPMGGFDVAARLCQEMVEKEGVQSITLCPGFTHEAVALVRKAVGEGIPINVTRADVPSTMITAQILTKEGWL
jgi:hypothetical protein